MNEAQYPRMICHLSALRQNVRAVTQRCHAVGIQVAGVVKGATALPPVVDAFAEECQQLASSRLDQLEKIHATHPERPAMLIRVPMLSELRWMLTCCDYSLQSDLNVLTALEACCAQMGKKHKVILMADLGDLREGWWDKDELVQAACYVEKQLSHVELAGIGTNLGCYGALVPTVEKMEELVALARRIETAIGRKLDIVSGGATSSYFLVHRHEMPAGINHLRIGEGILHARDMVDFWGITDADYLSHQVFTLQAEVLECRIKPSHPQGTIFVDAFGNKPTYQDRGLRRRALVGVGKVDLGDQSSLLPLDEGVEVLGGSSDHTILDVEHSPKTWKAGDVMSFGMNYTHTLFFTTAGGAVEVGQ